MTEDDVLMMIEARSRKSHEAVRQIISASGGQEALAKFDAKMRDVRSGVEGAKNLWHSISPAQRRVLLDLSTGRIAVRDPWNAHRYQAVGQPHVIESLCRLPTLRALCAHELLAPDGGVRDPERRFVLTERARFLLAHGRPA